MSAAVATNTWILAWAEVRNELRRRWHCMQPRVKDCWVDKARLLRVLPFSHAYGWNVQDYYNARRGTNLPFSPLDWLLLGTWAEAGIAQCAIERGIDEMFDGRDLAFRSRQINSLAYCQYAIMRVSEEMKEASVGSYVARSQPRLHAMVLALPPGRPMFQALQSQRQVDAVAEQFGVGIVFTVAPDEYRKHLARERFSVELEFLDHCVERGSFNPDTKPMNSGSRLAGSAPLSDGAGSSRPFLKQENLHHGDTEARSGKELQESSALDIPAATYDRGPHASFTHGETQPLSHGAIHPTSWAGLQPSEVHPELTRRSQEAS